MQTKKKGCEHMLVEAFETAFPNHDFGWRQSGSSALGFCPFHNDKHQRSLSVYLKVRFLILSSCVQNGKITLKEAAAYSEMSIEEFTQR